MASQIKNKFARSIVAGPETETFDLAGYSTMQAQELVQGAFTSQLKITEQIRITFVVGAGKGGRSKYPPGLTKALTLALERSGYEMDTGACAVASCQKKFKHQHDTGKNLMYIHVFPEISTKKDEAAEDSEDEEEEETAEDVVLDAEEDHFKGLLKNELRSWLQKRRVLAVLQQRQGDLELIELKMTTRKRVTEKETQIYCDADRELLASKIKLTQAAMKHQVTSGHITAYAKRVLLDTVIDKLAELDVSLGTATEGAEGSASLPPKPPAKGAARLQKKRAALRRRQDMLEQINPKATMPLRHAAEMRAMWRRVVALESNPSAPMNQLAALPQLKRQFGAMAAASKLPFEGDEEWAARVIALKQGVGRPSGRRKGKARGGKSNSRKAPTFNAAPARRSNRSGWSQPAQGRSTNNGRNTNNATGGGGFAALMGSSSDED